jgi:hypothetical protein
VIEHPAAPAAITLALVASAEAIANVKLIASKPALPMFVVVMSVVAVCVVAVCVVVLTHSVLVSIKAGAGSPR